MIPYLFWSIVYKVHPFIKRFVLYTGLMKHSGRQPYLIGSLKPEISIEEVFNYLQSNGYEHNRIAWVDDGEILNVRKRISIYQYHLRVHEDGEIRGHYEFAPESRPIRHMLDKTINETEYFIDLLAHFLKNNKKFLNFSHIRKKAIEE